MFSVYAGFCSLNAHYMVIFADDSVAKQRFWLCHATQNATQQFASTKSVLCFNLFPKIIFEKLQKSIDITPVS